MKFVPASSNQTDDAASLIYDSSHELLGFMFLNREDAVHILTRLLSYSSGHFGHKFTTLLKMDSKVVGVELGYSYQQLKSQELPGTLNTFRAVPVRLWPHIIGNVRKALDGYVPLPSVDAYYINNIAVDTSVRGRGLGRLLLEHTVNIAGRQGFRCVELDVTEPNSNAIKFYERNGFSHVSISGTDELESLYKLPKLCRMRLLLDEQQPINTNNHGVEDNSRIVNDVTRLNPVEVDEVYVPGTVEQLQSILRNTDKPVSIGGGRFSMGGQTAEAGTLHIDVRGLDKIIALDVENRTITVEAGIRWRNIQSVITNYGLAVKVMQTYSDFTVGGSLSVNCHGRYIGLGPIILSVLSVKIVMHDGSLVNASSEENNEIFYAVIGGYGAIGIIVEVQLSLAENSRIERISKKMITKEYVDFFRKTIRDNRDYVFHNADLVPPDFKSLRAVTWRKTEKPVNQEQIRDGRRLYLAEMYMLWAITETPLGHLRRKYIYDPLIYLRKKITYRNDEANYDVTELEPLSRHSKTYVLQEYFVPPEKLLEFIDKMAEILHRFDVQVVNVSVRHAFKDPGSLLAWAPEEIFALVLYYKQGTSKADCERVAIWTRELIDAALQFNGRYYLVYQPHALYEQFHSCYPDAKVLFKMKSTLDPDYRFRNCLWEKYYRKNRDASLLGKESFEDSEFRSVYNDISTRDGFYLFLQNIYHLYPEHEFHCLIIDACERLESDKEIYKDISCTLPNIKTSLSDITYALPALVKQKKMIAQQTSNLLESVGKISGYLEIGSTGRYVKSLRKSLNMSGPVYLCNDVSPDYSLPEIMERGRIRKIGKFFDLDDYKPISDDLIEEESLDLVTCYIGLHHCARTKLSEYIKSIHRVLRPGGNFILRDHNADTDEMKVFCSLVHTVFNAGLNVSWEDNNKEVRLFEDIDFWVDVITNHGFKDSGERILQDYDPSKNTLMRFIKDR